MDSGKKIINDYTVPIVSIIVNSLICICILFVVIVNKYVYMSILLFVPLFVRRFLPLLVSVGYDYFLS